jgi:hypothetical protein
MSVQNEKSWAYARLQKAAKKLRFFVLKRRLMTCRWHGLSPNDSQSWPRRVYLIQENLLSSTCPAYYNDEDFEFWRVWWLHTRGRWCSKMAKINFKLRTTRIFTCFDHKMVSVSIFTIIKKHFFFTKLLYLAVFFAFFIWKVSLNLTWIVPSEFKTKQFFFASVETQKLIVQQKCKISYNFVRY